MKITLKNFRCHTSGEYVIPDEGLVLLGGKMGSGKSSLLNAIAYALYGSCALKGKSRKVYSHGTKSCQVRLEMERYNLIVTRSSGPSRLVVEHDGVAYEDVAAQGVVEGIMGMNFLEFMASSYVIQRRNNSVISMTPSEQAKFIQTLAFSDGTHLEYRKLFSEYVRECKDELIRVKSRLEVVTEQLKDRESRLPETLPKEIEGESLKKVTAQEKKIKLSLQQQQKAIRGLNKELKEKRTRDETRQQLIAEKETFEREVKHYQGLIEELGEVKEEIDIQEMKDALSDLKEDLKMFRDYQQYQKDKKHFTTMRDKFFHERKKRLSLLQKKRVDPSTIKALEKQLAEKEVAHEQYQELSYKAEQAENIKARAETTVKRVMQEVKDIYRNMRRLRKIKSLFDFLKKKENEYGILIEKLKEELETALRHTEASARLTKHYTCPHCDIALCFSMDGETLVEVTEKEAKPTKIDDNTPSLRNKLGETEMKYERCKGWIVELEEAIPLCDTKIPQVPEKASLDEVMKLKEEISTSKQLQQDTDALAREIANKTLSSTLVELEKELNKQQRQFPSDYTPPSGEGIVEDMESEIEDTSASIRIEWEKRSTLSINTRKLKKAERELAEVVKTIPRRKEKRTAQIIEAEIEKAQDTFSQISEELEEIREKLEILRALEAYHTLVGDVEKLKKKVEDSKDKIKDAEWNLQGALGLEKAGKEAEILAMEQTIASINEYARVYLDKMFSEPITVRLESSKTVGTGSRAQLRTQINTVIRYRGHIYDSVDEWSGGEAQLCELAFLLAVNDMLGSNIIFLDECINHLDAEINQDVLMKLREFSGGKLILVASHEATRGVFDHIIPIKKVK